MAGKSKSKQTQSANRKGVLKVMQKIQKKYGKDSIGFVGDDIERYTIKRHHDPSTDFGVMTGGGLGRGRIVEYVGATGSGKTSKALEDIAEEQRLHPDCICGWYESEDSFDPVHATNLGVDLNRLAIIDQSDFNKTEEALDAFRALLEPADESERLNMIVINSIAGFAPSAEVEGDIGDAQIALTARLMSKLMRVTSNRASKANTTLIFINQERTDIGGYKGPAISTGGLALRFFASQRFKFYKSKIEASDPISENDGMKIKVRVIKNRLNNGTNPYKECYYYANYSTGINNDLTLSKLLLESGIITQGGAWFSCASLGKKWQGIAKFNDEMLGNSLMKEYFIDLLEGKTAMNDLTPEEIETINAGDEKAREFIASTLDENESMEALEAELQEQDNSAQTA